MANLMIDFLRMKRRNRSVFKRKPQKPTWSREEWENFRKALINKEYRTLQRIMNEQKLDRKKFYLRVRSAARLYKKEEALLWKGYHGMITFLKSQKQ